MIELLTEPFMVRALLAATFTGILAPGIGVYIVQRQMSMLGDGLGHIAIAGVGLALVTGSAPLPAAIAICVIGAIVIEWARTKTNVAGDLSLAVLFYGGLALGVLLAAKAGAGAAGLTSYLFGSLTSVTKSDVTVIGAIGIVVITLLAVFRSQLLAVHADAEAAQAQGLPVMAYNMMVMIGAALTVALSLRTIGVLLVASLMVIPVGTARNLTFGFGRIQWVSMAIGVSCAIGGTVLSVVFDTAPGATCVLVAVITFFLSAIFSYQKT